MRFCSHILILCTLTCLCVVAQNPQLQTKNGAVFATVVFTRALSTETPRFFSIAIDSTGSTTYQSAPASLQQTGNPYTVEFSASAGLRDKIFSDVNQLHFFQIPASTLQQPTANEGVNTLTFREGNTDNLITYHDSSNALVRELTFVFEGISETLEFGRELAQLHSSHSPQLDSVLDHMLDLTRRNRLQELFVVAPVLQGLESDRAEPEAVRSKAKDILAQVQAAGNSK